MGLFSRQRTRTRRVTVHKVRPGGNGDRRPRLAAAQVRPAIVVTLVVAAAAVALLYFGNPPLRYHLGDTVNRPEYARADFTYTDNQLTQQMRDAEAKSVPDFYLMNTTSLEQTRQRLNALLDQVQNANEAAAPDRALLGEDLTLAPTVLTALRADLGKKDQSTVRQVLGELFDHLVDVGVISHLRERQQSTAGRVNIADPARGRSGATNITELLTPQSVGNLARQRLSDKLDPSLAGIVDPLSEWLSRNVKPTLSEDVETTREERSQARQRIPLQEITVARGDVFLKPGTQIESLQLHILLREQEAYLEQLAGTSYFTKRFLGVLLLTAVTFGLGLAYLILYRSKVALSWSQMLTLALSILVVIGAAKLCVQFRAPLYLIPMSFTTIVLALAHDRIFALGVSLFVLVPVSITVGNDFRVLVVLLIGAIVASLLTTRINKRSKLIVVGLLVGLAQAVAVLGVGLLEDMHVITMLHQSFWGLTNGVVVGFLVTGILPFMERGLHITTDISLLELADLNQPILENMALDAPGSYNHSLAVGVLAEAAAEVIGADELLARLGAYYHDVGKLNKPQYFIENGPAATRLHEHLSPNMSTLIIIAHVKDGLEIAEDLQLPAAIREIILQHHGTTKVEYFYKKAREQHPEDNVRDQSFRYSGPRPQTKEAAVVMLADAVESAARTLPDSSPGNIEHLVHQIAQNRLNEGQLDECNITLDEVHRVEQALTRGLTSIYHSRVRY